MNYWCINLSYGEENQQYYIEILMELLERARRKLQELWRDGWTLHQEDAPAHNALSVNQVSANKNITALEYPTFSPHLAPCDFCFFPKIKSVFRGTHFVLVENVKAKMAENPNRVLEHELRNCFEHWQHHLSN